MDDVMDSKPLLTYFLLSDVDIEALTETSVFNGMDIGGKQFPEIISDYITGELAKVGGTAIVTVDETACLCLWHTPVGVPVSDKDYLLYVSHMLQIGLLKNVGKIVADTVYAGNGLPLMQVLLQMHILGYNKYVAERDMLHIALAAPMMGLAWLSAGMMFASSCNFKDAGQVFDRLLSLEPNNTLGLEYMAMIKSQDEPKLAVEYAERLFRYLAKVGQVPDMHSRVTYGFALLALGLKQEARVQFDMVCDGQKPKMTMCQWRDWGFLLPLSSLKKALLDPLDEEWLAIRSRNGTGIQVKVDPGVKGIGKLISRKLGKTKKARDDKDEKDGKDEK